MSPSIEPEVYSVRRLTPEDWQEFASLRLEALQKYPQFFGSKYAVESAYTKGDWQKWLSYKDGQVFALYEGSSIVGITGIRSDNTDPTGTTGFLIKPEHQGKGLSFKLYQARIDWALDYLQWKRLVVSHREGNESSRRANQKWGFRYTGKTPKNWPDGTTADDYHYQLDLEEFRRSKRNLT